MQFQQREPRRILTDAETLAVAGLTPKEAFPETGMDVYTIKSPMLCAFMDELEKDGYVYNSQALRAFEKAHDLPASSENGSALSLLVYTSQQFRRHDQLVRDGWKPGSPEMLREAFDAGNGIQVIGESAFGGNVREVFRVREIGGKLYAMRPHARNKAMAVGGMPCKIVPIPKKPRVEKASPSPAFA